MADAPNVCVPGRKGRAEWICMRVKAEANRAQAVLVTGTLLRLPRLCAAVKRATRSMTVLILALSDDFLQHIKS